MDIRLWDTASTVQGFVFFGQPLASIEDAVYPFPPGIRGSESTHTDWRRVRFVRTLNSPASIDYEVDAGARQILRSDKEIQPTIKEDSLFPDMSGISRNCRDREPYGISFLRRVGKGFRIRKLIGIDRRPTVSPPCQTRVRNVALKD